MWFSKKYKKLDLENKRLIKELEIKLSNSANLIKELQSRLSNVNSNKEENMMITMIESFGLPIDFSEADSKGLPTHYLSGLDEKARHNFLGDMETIYQNSNFNNVIRYMLNRFATQCVLIEDSQKMKNNQIAVVAFRMFLNELKKMHKEFIGGNSQDEDFDDLEALPE